MKKIFFLLLFLWANQLFAQQLPPVNIEISKAIPASADAAALGKYGSIPVSPYTGVPNISIPLYTIKSGDLSLPVSLSYHASGNKVEEMASSVGLGWVLNAGGAITRTVRGIADEATYGFLDPTHYVPNILKRLANDNTSTFSQALAMTYMNGIGMGTIDGQPDMFNFNFGGYSGKFVMDGNGGVMLIPQQNITFTYSVLNNQIVSFTAKTPDGVTYYFGSNNGNTAVESTTSTSNRHSQVYFMSWFISKITSPSLHEIDFNYVPDTYSQLQVPSQTLYTWIGGDNNSPRNDPPDQYLNSNITFNTVRLSSVIFDNGTLTVNADSTRRDIGNKCITSLVFANTGSSFVKKYNLYYYNSNFNRLRLDSLVGQLEPLGNKYKKERYRFSYQADSWQPASSNFIYSQDWWGYHNGQANVVYGIGTLVPGMDYNILGTNVSLPGANRSPSESDMMDGMLNQVTYPTGGYTTFTYEANHEASVDLGGTSPAYPPIVMEAHMSNDPLSIYHNSLDSIYLVVKGNSGAPVPVTFIVSGLEGASSVRASVKDSTHHVLSFLNNSADTTIWLYPNNYTITISDPKQQTNPALFNYVKFVVEAVWNNPNPLQSLVYNFVAGGLRIKQIADYDGVNNNAYNVKTYKYTLPGNSNVSSGNIVFQPNYYYQLIVNRGGGLDNFLYHNTYLTRTAVSNYPLATTQGEVVGYSYVQELIGGSGQNGRNDYSYTTSGEYPDLASDLGFPFAPYVDQDWHRGLLLEETNYKNVGGTYFKVQDKTLNYGTSTSSFNKGIKAGFNPVPALYDPSLTYYNIVPLNGDGELFATLYADATDFNYMSSQTIKTYDSNDTTKFTQTTSTYQYDPSSYLLRQVQSTNSKNEHITQTVTYPYDYSTFANPTGSLLGVQNLTNMGIANYPVEEVTTRSNVDGSNLRTVKAVLTTYKAKVPYRDSVYEMRTVIPLTTFTGSSAGANNITKDSHYQPVVSFDKYDRYGNIVQERKAGDVERSYIWAYPTVNLHYNSYPVAEVVNADSVNIAYTNFESYPADGTGAGNWIYANTASADTTAPMGPNYFTVSSLATLSKTGLTSATVYVVSFWAKTGAAITVSGGTVTNVATGNAKSGWIYHEYSVTGATTVTIGGTGSIDEVRLYPSTAQMSTYTYIPLVGMASKCDIKNDITYYVYDNVGRLIRVLDQNRNIIKQYQYNYQNSGQ